MFRVQSCTPILQTEASGILYCTKWITIVLGLMNSFYIVCVWVGLVPKIQILKQDGHKWHGVTFCSPLALALRLSNYHSNYSGNIYLSGACFKSGFTNYIYFMLKIWLVDGEAGGLFRRHYSLKIYSQGIRQSFPHFSFTLHHQWAEIFW